MFYKFFWFYRKANKLNNLKNASESLCSWANYISKEHKIAILSFFFKSYTWKTLPWITYYVHEM